MGKVWYYNEANKLFNFDNEFKYLEKMFTMDVLLPETLLRMDTRSA